MTEEETGLEGAVADDADAEYVRGVCERDIVGAGTALARYAPLLRWLLANPARCPPALQAAAALTYTRSLTVQRLRADVQITKRTPFYYGFIMQSSEESQPTCLAMR